MTKARTNAPLAPTEVVKGSGPVCLVPVLRAGPGMLDGALDLLPEAAVGFMGLQRDEETAEPVEYYVTLPREFERYFSLDPRSDAGNWGKTLSDPREAQGVRGPIHD